jgi:RNA recognition motif-containing protein
VNVVKSNRTQKSKPSNVDYGNVIWVGNLSNYTTNERLKDFFYDCGTILDVRRPVFEDSQKPKNHAFIEFDSSQAVNAGKTEI